MDITIHDTKSEPIHFTHSSEDPLLIKAVNAPIFHQFTLSNVTRGNKPCPLFVTLTSIIAMRPVGKKNTEITLVTGQVHEVTETIHQIVTMCEEHAIFLEMPCPVDNTHLQEIR